jgi:hypothetical protein
MVQVDGQGVSKESAMSKTCFQNNISALFVLDLDRVTNPEARLVLIAIAMNNVYGE